MASDTVEERMLDLIEETYGKEAIREECDVDLFGVPFGLYGGDRAFSGICFCASMSVWTSLEHTT